MLQKRFFCSIELNLELSWIWNYFHLNLPLHLVGEMPKAAILCNRHTDFLFGCAHLQRIIYIYESISIIVVNRMIQFFFVLLTIRQIWAFSGNFKKKRNNFCHSYAYPFHAFLHSTNKPPENIVWFSFETNRKNCYFRNRKQKWKPPKFKSHHKYSGIVFSPQLSSTVYHFICVHLFIFSFQMNEK